VERCPFALLRVTAYGSPVEVLTVYLYMMLDGMCSVMREKVTLSINK